MLKAVYGLKQAPRQWWKKLHAFLKSMGFVSNQSDACFYVLRLTGGAVVLLLLYVDDIMLAASTTELVIKYAKRIAEGFKVSSEGPLDNFLGISIRVDRVELSMPTFMEKVFKRFKLVAKQSIVVPMQEGIVAALAIY